MIEAGLQQFLLADPAISGLIATRSYPMVWPDAPTFPLPTYQLISTTTGSVLSGPLSMCTVRIQFDAWGATYSDAKSLAYAVNNVLEGFQGVLPNGLAVDNILLDNSQDLFDSPSLRYRVSSDYLVSYTRQ